MGLKLKGEVTDIIMVMVMDMVTDTVMVTGITMIFIEKQRRDFFNMSNLFFLQSTPAA